MFFWKNWTRALLIMAVPVFLGACSSTADVFGSEIQEGPVGTGAGVNELKGSPCACTEIPMTIPESARMAG